MSDLSHDRDNDDADIVSAGARAAKLRRLISGAAIGALLAVGAYVFVLPKLNSLSSPAQPEETEISPVAGTQNVVLSLASPRSSAEKFAPLIDRIAGLEAKISSLEEKLAQQPPAAQAEEKIAALQRRIDALEHSPSSAANLQHIALLSTFTQLQKAVKQGQAFSGELAQLASLSQNRPQMQSMLAPLQPFSTRRSQTLAELQAQFAQALEKAAAHGEEQGSLAANLRSLIRIRKEGRPGGNDDASILARAESSLGDGDVDATLRELGTLSPERARDFSGWIASAQQYQRLHSLVDALQLQLAQPEPASVP